MTFAGPAELTEAVAARSRRQHRAREIEHGLPNAHDLRMRRAHGHSLPRWQMTRRRRTPLALDLDEAGAAGAERTAVGVPAELGQRDAHGALLLLGIAERLLGLLFTIEFLVAFFYVKLPAGFNGARLDLMLLVGGLLIFLAGPGRAAVDALWLEEDDRARYQIMERAV